MDQQTFEKEIAICQEHYAKKQGCGWGRCESCGVLPLLRKLFKGDIIEGESEVKKLKDEIFG